MDFTPTPIDGGYVIAPEVFEDERGSFSRQWCADELQAHGIPVPFVQANLSTNRVRGTLRGLHYQTPPHAEGKLVSCTVGAIYDVMVDLRPDSPTYLQSFGVELSRENRRKVYVPPGCAHGYQTLTDEADVYYTVTAAYAPDFEAGLRYDDPAIDLTWPLPVQSISGKDRAWPDLKVASSPTSS